MNLESARRPKTKAIWAVAVGAALLTLAGCGSSDSSESGASNASGDSVVAAEKGAPGTTLLPSAERSFKAEVWVDNWFALYSGDVKVGEDSVPITTERSFNSETFTFTGGYPLELRAVSKDFKEDDTGLEYIGTGRQQMGDGGFIAQITDLSTGQVVAVTDGSWKGLVIHAAPINDCADSDKPEEMCEHRITPEPTDWKATAFDDATWAEASVYSEDEVGVKEGYNKISWDKAAKLIWTSDLKVDNTILWRKTVQAPS